MLDTETKRRIDTARDILVGKVPDPKSQVEQITIALIYKFMDDMDKEAISFGGKATFFTGEYEQYSWTNIFDTKVGGHEMLTLYGEAIVKLNLNPNIPQLFRDIFKNAYLPYRDPETLKLFLKTINEFSYDHSEMLGDAFEYLLSVLGSQGDAGQFRTPRHIIDFMVEILQPKKNESILDPACGTAGFLISSFKHILKSNSSPLGRSGGAGDLLTPDDRKKMMKNFVGYDISPDMVRLSLVNLYLHGFTTPSIYEYDTLTSEERWSEYFDVIIANPPFMTPKGGIKPHKKFSVQANRSEVLFVDYIAEHIHPSTGRAGIIVPEGIIFQSATAYKALRKMLVDKNYLYAVVSLPAGIFQPYSGVKTSILLMDKTLAKKTDNILFVKIENDGFDLGAQRRAIDKNDLTGCLELLQQYKTALQDNTTFEMNPKDSNVYSKKENIEGATPSESYQTNQMPSINIQSLRDSQFLIVAKEKIAANGDYNLSVDRYRVNENVQQSNFEMVRLGDLCEFEYGKPLKDENRIAGDYPVYGSNGIVGFHNKYLVEAPFIVVGRKGSAGSLHFSERNGFPIDTAFFIKLKSEKKIYLKFLFHCLQTLDLKNVNIQAGVPGLNRNDAYDLKIPLPPLSIQQQIVSKIESFQKIIDGAKQVTENYKPQIEIDASWVNKSVLEVCDITTGKLNANQADENGQYPFFTCSKEIFKINKYAFDCEAILLSGNNASGDFDVKHYKGKFNAYQRTYIITVKKGVELDYELLRNYLHNYLGELKSKSIGGLTKYLTLGMITELQIPLPPISVQQEIVKRIEEEQALINSSKKLIEIFEQKIKDEINKLWQAETKMSEL